MEKMKKTEAQKIFDSVEMIETGEGYYMPRNVCDYDSILNKLNEESTNQFDDFDNDKTIYNFTDGSIVVESYSNKEKVFAYSE